MILLIFVEYEKSSTSLNFILFTQKVLMIFRRSFKDYYTPLMSVLLDLYVEIYNILGFRYFNI